MSGILCFAAATLIELSGLRRWINEPWRFDSYSCLLPLLSCRLFAILFLTCSVDVIQRPNNQFFQ